MRKAHKPVNQEINLNVTECETVRGRNEHGLLAEVAGETYSVEVKEGGEVWKVLHTLVPRLEFHNVH